jgi:hypothetical protein
MWVGSMTLEYVKYSMSPQSKWEYSFIVHTFRFNLEIWVELESGHYAQKLLFIP